MRQALSRILMGVLLGGLLSWGWALSAQTEGFPFENAHLYVWDGAVWYPGGGQTTGVHPITNAHMFVWTGSAWTPATSLTVSDNPPGGSDTQVQFNEGGVFGGSPNFTFTSPDSLPELDFHGGFFIHGNTGSTGFGFLDDADSFVGEFDAVGGSLALSNVSFQQVLYADATTTVFASPSLPTSVFGTTITMGGPVVVAGSTPAVANVGANSCGTTAAAIAGNDNAGTITVGATSGSQCRVTFVKAATTRRECTVTDETTTIATRASYVDVSNTDFLGVFGAGNLVSYVCFAR